MHTYLYPLFVFIPIRGLGHWTRVPLKWHWRAKNNKSSTTCCHDFSTRTTRRVKNVSPQNHGRQTKQQSCFCGSNKRLCWDSFQLPIFATWYHRPPFSNHRQEWSTTTLKIITILWKHQKPLPNRPKPQLGRGLEQPLM